MRRLLLLGLVLAGAALAPGGASGVGPNWKALERPLHLPKLAPGEGCPTSKLAPQITAKKYGVGGALGSGPVFPMIGGTTLATVFQPPFRGAWAGTKVLWFVLPNYKGPVLIRGRKVGGSQLMRFDGGTHPPAQIRLAPGQRSPGLVAWIGQVPGSRGRESYVRVRAPGCYGVQIDGTSFSTVVIFKVTTSR